ncbi:hypothetical protein AB4156_07610 [Cupriavidus sp. 2MCAB6]|uniref:hypothetical protein n=1 Tax=Cupriavidus sp. 2MCAB6 TaxID=3232981 RepID=UPI003F8F9EE2
MKRSPRFGASLCASILACLLAVAVPATANAMNGLGQSRAFSAEERLLGLDVRSSERPDNSLARGSEFRPDPDGAGVGLLAMSPLEVASVTAIGKPGPDGGVSGVVLALIDGIGQVPLAGPALITLIAGVADVIGWCQDVPDSKPHYHDSLALPATSSPQA